MATEETCDQISRRFVAIDSRLAYNYGTSRVLHTFSLLHVRSIYYKYYLYQIDVYERVNFVYISVLSNRKIIHIYVLELLINIIFIFEINQVH